MRIEPLANFPIERDLVVDLSDFIEKLERIKPYIIPKEEKKDDEEYLQTPTQLEKYHQFSGCINCGLCYAACPQYKLNKEFIGPAVIALAYRYNLDSRDAGMKQRLELLNQESGVWSCTFVGYCSQVCPKGVDSTTDYIISKITPGAD